MSRIRVCVGPVWFITGVSCNSSRFFFTKEEFHATATYLNAFFTVSTNMNLSLNTSSSKLSTSLALWDGNGYNAVRALPPTLPINAAKATLTSTGLNWFAKKVIILSWVRSILLAFWYFMVSNVQGYLEKDFYTFALFRGQSRQEKYKKYCMFLLALLQWLCSAPHKLKHVCINRILVNQFNT